MTDKKKATELVTRFAETVRAHEMRGSRPPEEWDAIVHNYREARSELACRFHHTIQARDEALDVLSPVLDYCREAGIGKPGESMTQALIEDHKRLAAERG